MSTRKATHNGTCQICGRVQAVDGKLGMLAKHGYSVTWNSFVGTCTGSDRLPVEKNTKHLDRAVIDLLNDAQRLEALTIEDITTVELVVDRQYDYRLMRKTVDVKKLVTREEFDAFVNDPANLVLVVGRGYKKYNTFDHKRGVAFKKVGINARHMRKHAEFLTQLKADRHGKDLYPRIERKLCSTRGCTKDAIGEFTTYSPRSRRRQRVCTEHAKGHESWDRGDGRFGQTSIAPY